MKHLRTLSIIVIVVFVIIIACNNDNNGNEENMKDCTVTFALGYTTSKIPPQPITVRAGTSAGSLFPGNPARPARSFIGWRDQKGVQYTRDTIIKSNITLTANWRFTPGPVNPIITDRFTADPAVFVDGATVYIVCGEDKLPPDAPSNEYYRIPHWVMYSTQDMSNFKYEGIILKSDDFPYGQPNSAWASQIIKGRDGMYYFYVTVKHTNGLQTVGVAVAENPTGPYFPVRTPVVTRDMVNADTGYSTDDNIDPTVFIDDDGTAYLSWGQRQPRIAQLKSNMTEIERPIKMLFQDGWTQTKRDGDYVIRFEEGPYLYKKDGHYYMFYASMRRQPDNSSSIGETLSYAMADDINGPWTDGVEISDCAPGINGEGNSFTVHPAVFEFKGQSYMLYHNKALILNVDGVEWRGDTGRRSLAIDYLYFDGDGRSQFINIRQLTGISVPPLDF
ncbi:family 43 glycosylhydrolase [Treponema sp. R80B11-R83G3]